MRDEEEADYYLDSKGNLVFTEKYHLKRGYCCKNNCLHCPWNYGQEKDKGKNNNELDK